MNNNIIYLAPFKKIISFSIQNFGRNCKKYFYRDNKSISISLNSYLRCDFDGEKYV